MVERQPRVDFVRDRETAWRGIHHVQQESRSTGTMTRLCAPAGAVEAQQAQWLWDSLARPCGEA